MVPGAASPAARRGRPINGAYLFDFPDDDDPSVMYLENDVGIQEVTKADDVKNYTTIFGQIRDTALSPTATTTYLERA